MSNNHEDGSPETAAAAPVPQETHQRPLESITLKPTDKGRATYSGQLLTDMQDFYQHEGRSMTRTDLSLALENRFGERIVREVCLPNLLNLGACLVLAVAILTEGDHTLE
jgi:hypothetical protein